MRIRIPILFASALSAALVACGDMNSPVTPVTEASGVFVLIGLNGARLPAPFVDDTSVRIYVTSGMLLLKSDASFEEKIVTVTTYPHGPVGQKDTVITRGTFSVEGTQRTFSVPARGTDSAFSYTAAVNQDVLTCTRGGATYKYGEWTRW